MLKYFLFPIYLLQLENYNLKRFFRGSVRHLVERPTVWRKEITWTTKLQLVSGLAFALAIIVAWLIGYYSLFLGIVAFLVFIFKFFFFLGLASILLMPVEAVAKAVIISRAKTKLAKHPNLTVIGIAGSYGKTTMKEMVASVLKQKYQILVTPETVNTPIGIARLITDHLLPTTDYLIVEMGEFWHGDVKELCELVHPSIGIITGINEAHLERLGSLDTTIDTIFELAKYSKPDGLLLLNSDDVHINNNYKQYQGNHKLAFYSSHNEEQSQLKIGDMVFNENGGGQSFSVILSPSASEDEESQTLKTEIPRSARNDKKELKLTTQLLGHYALGTSMAAVILGRALGLNDLEIQKGIESLEPIPHRLQPIWNKENNVLVIDDSFNGNPDGVREAIAVLGKFKNRRKIYLTPGLVETGAKTKDIHIHIGVELAKVADKVLLIKNSVTSYIVEGLTFAGFKQENIAVFPTTQAAHSSLRKILQPGDVILFQNDWPDNYF